MNDMIEAYQEACRKLKAANIKLEELRGASVPYLTHQVVTERDEDGNATNWYNALTTDRAVLKTFKSFLSQVETVSSLSTKASIAQRRMIETIETEGDES